MCVLWILSVLELQRFQDMFFFLFGHNSCAMCSLLSPINFSLFHRGKVKKLFTKVAIRLKRVRNSLYFDYFFIWIYFLYSLPNHLDNFPWPELDCFKSSHWLIFAFLWVIFVRNVPMFFILCIIHTYPVCAQF